MELEAAANVDERSATCAGGCRRHAARGLLLGAAGWLALAALSLGLVLAPDPVGESLCGIWGCFPPFPALAAMHLFWASLAGGAVWLACGLLPGRALLRVGLTVAVVSLAGVAVAVATDLPHWLDTVPDSDHRLWPLRAAYRLATLSDVPLAQGLGAGLACAALGARRRG